MISVQFLSVSTFCISIALAIELTFELPDKEKQCFHEDMFKFDKATVEFQVIQGGKYDVDATLEAPDGKSLYRGRKQQFENFSWTAGQNGTYTLCFSNEFSSFSHKRVYLYFFVGEEKLFTNSEKRLTAMTKIEASLYSIHEQLNVIDNYQIHHRFREAQSRNQAVDLNSRVIYWSVGETVLLIVIAVGQVMLLKNFFTEKK